MTIDLDAIRRRIPFHYAAPWRVEQNGDWHKQDRNGSWLVGYNTDNPLAGLVATVPDYGYDLAEFITHAREDVPELLAEVERLRAIVASVVALTKDTDGNDLDQDSDLPVGVFMQALHEAPEPTFEPGWLQTQVARSVASLDRLPDGLRQSLNQTKPSGGAR